MPEHKSSTVLKKELSGFGLSDRDLDHLSEYVDKADVPGLLAPGVLSNFVHYCRDIGFPSSEGMLKDNIGTEQHSYDLIVAALIKAKILETYEVAGGMMKDIVNRTAAEDKSLKKNPEDEITVYDYDPKFVQEIGGIAKRLEMKSEGIMSMEDSRLALEELRMKLGLHEEDFQDTEAFKDLDDDSLEKLSDGLLLALSELEASGKIHKFKTPGDAKNALMSAIRKLYQSRGLIGKEGRKFQRFGTQKILRGAKRDIAKASRRHESVNESESMFNTDVDTTVLAYNLSNANVVDLEFDHKKTHLVWKTEEEYRAWGIQAITPHVSFSAIDIPYTLVDGEKSESKVITLKVPDDIDMEFSKSNDGGIFLVPSRIEISLSGDAKDSSTWKIESIEIEWSC